MGSDVFVAELFGTLIGKALGIEERGRGGESERKQEASNVAEEEKRREEAARAHQTQQGNVNFQKMSKDKRH